MADELLPVTILSGGLGAGKTTTLNHLLREGGERHDIAVLVNDVGEANIDADLVENGTDLSIDDGTVTELSNGCICCGLRDELDRELERLATQETFDYLLIEPSGISDPVPIAERFVSAGRVAARYDLDSIVTVVDAAQFHWAFVAGEPLEQTTDGTRPLSDLLVEQVEFCDVVLLNKCDLVDDDERRAVERVLRMLRPDVEIVRTTDGRVDPDRTLETGRFDSAEIDAAARWKRAIDDDERAPDSTHDHGHANDDGREHGYGDDDGHKHGRSNDGEHEHSHESDGEHDHLHPPAEFGVESFVYDRYRPFHPERVHDWLTSFPESVIRAKGHCWVAGRERYALDLSQAGTEIHVDVNGRWAATLPSFQRESYRESQWDGHWDEEWGDRETKLVFIGAGMDETAIVDAMDGCLLDDAEMRHEWDTYENPFPGDWNGSAPPEEQRLVIDETR
ncbi:GTP-binding protein [Natrinema sp. SYSU A 869]|uniref:CobW family GTP-binding protein n=1 Tax=Natrinema sp. SYSU A 869 TaxID=2871694 RepID=UPI001CA3BEA9|nr:GTP-binding protein [Natrinema sp. SYSU A 869]